MQRQVCPLCALDEFITVMETDDGHFELVCTNTGCDYSWRPKLEKPGVSARSGIAADLGIYEDLLTCIDHEEPWTEYGVVEYRYKNLRPDIYANDLLPRYGHHADGSNKKYSASKFLAGALGQLHREGLITSHRWKPTGYWNYLSLVSYWSWTVDTAQSQRLTWIDFAVDRGVDPEVWSLR